MNKLLIGLTSWLLLGSQLAYAQGDSTQNRNVFELPVEEVLESSPNTSKKEVSIVSVSTRIESEFEVPLGVSVIRQEEILKAGCLSLVEALRLAPGLVVRETSAGNYDVHIRGMNTLPPNGDFTSHDNSNTLVMIDSRPVYNYFSGSTFWESLPIDIQDLDRIEIIRGPSAALYGPNAINGVIHLITRRPESNGAYTMANLQVGNHGTLVAQGAYGFKFTDQLTVIASASTTRRNRHSSDFFSLGGREYVSNLSQLISYQTRQLLGDTRSLAAILTPMYHWIALASIPS
ncbi:MAG: TonB-dependent receptor plug domain-containing protein [Bacteroidia bacterium]|nr:TonB-dependent receptor plug domain-containing protein [Bacteroidia bacterium]